MTEPHHPPGGGPYSQPPPTAVPGWEAAARAGALPMVPSEPPSPTVSPSAGSSLRHLWTTVAAVVVVLVLVMVLGSSGGRLGLVTVVLLLTAAAVGAFVGWAMVQRWGRAVLAETRRGYTTSPFALGRFWLRPAPGAPWTVGWVGWDFSGVWVLEADGRVRSAPQGDVLPPGFYPSPRGDGLWELWTGSQWSNWVTSAPSDS